MRRHAQMCIEQLPTAAWSRHTMHHRAALSADSDTHPSHQQARPSQGCPLQPGRLQVSAPLTDPSTLDATHHTPLPVSAQIDDFMRLPVIQTWLPRCVTACHRTCSGCRAPHCLAAGCRTPAKQARSRSMSETREEAKFLSIPFCIAADGGACNADGCRVHKQRPPYE